MVQTTFPNRRRRKSVIKRRKIRWMAVILVSALTVAHFQAVGASTMNKAKNEKKKAEEELNQANQKIEDIERQQSALQSEIDQKDAELVNLLVNIGILEDELTNKNTQLEQVTAELSEAEETEKEQYASMKKRIQFMYERGDTAMIDALLGSADMSDFLNRVEYVSDIYEYDRNLLTQYQITVRQVADLKTTVETEKAELEDMQEEYALQQSSLESVLAQKRSQMGNYDNQLASAQAAADKYKSTIDAQNRIIKEEERRQREAEEAARAAEARAREEANQKKANSNSQSNSGTDSSENSSGGGSGSSGNDGNSGGGANPGYSTGVSGSDVVNYACQFVGNPYVWGGTSLTNGADCSGFVMSVFANFGISLPHSSAALQGCGKAVSYANAQPGDLICYSGHVGIYMGGGQIVHAQSTAVGITKSSATYRTIVAVRRVL
ncbi:MAG: hydrolase [Eubacterium sp.]|jgi:cell wall-associated NlpC family hydrolase|nr:hydrolase [Eubacterium sp.]